MAPTCRQDLTFGPSAEPCRFDFTLKFENIVFELLPDGLFIVLAVIRLHALLHHESCTRRSRGLGRLKTIAAVILQASSIILTALDVVNHQNDPIAIAARPFDVIASSLVVWLSFLEHRRSLRPSTLLQCYLLLTAVLKVAQLRTLVLSGASKSVILALGVNLALKICLLWLESAPKRPISNAETTDKIAPEEVNGVFDRRLFWWLNTIFYKGYRSSFTGGQLPRLDSRLMANPSRHRFLVTICSTRESPGSSFIWQIILLSHLHDFLFPVFPKLIYVAAIFAQPLVIRDLVSNNQAPSGHLKNDTGYGLIGAVALVYSLIALSNSWYWQSVSRFNTKIRGCLIHAVYLKSLKKQGQEDTNALMLMNVDVEKVLLGTRLLHEYWSSVVTFAVGLYLLFEQVGVAFLPALIILIFCFLVCLLLGRFVRARQSAWLQATQHRVAFVTKIVAASKGVRLLNYSHLVEKIGISHRRTELALQRHVRKLIVVSLTLSLPLLQICALGTFVTFSLIQGPRSTAINPGKVFTTLAILQLLISPMNILLQGIPPLSGSIAALWRIQDFLLSRERSEPRRLISTPTEPGISNNRGRREKSNHHLAANRIDDDVVVEASRVYLGTTNCSLSNGKIKFCQGTFNFLIGSPGSGKSRFMLSVLDELGDPGVVQVQGNNMAYCGQTPWIWKGTIRDNIVGPESFDLTWYTYVVWACALVPDLTSISGGDNAQVSSKGSSLSGGQKQRIALARAIYSRKTILLLDDSLSGIDKPTKEVIFRRIFSSQGLLRRSQVTLVAVISDIGCVWLRCADKILVFENGCVAHQGSLDDLRASGAYTSNSDVDNQVKEHCEDQEVFDLDMHAGLVQSEPTDLKNDDEQLIGNAKGTGDWTVYKYYASTFGGLRLVIYFVLLLLFVGTTSLQSLWLNWWASSSFALSHDANISVFVVITVINVLAVIGWLCYSVLHLFPRSTLNLYKQQFGSLLRASFPYISNSDTGPIINRFSQDISLIDGPLFNAVVNTTQQLFSLLASLALVVAATPYIGAIIPIIGSVFWLIQHVYLRTSRQLRILDLEAKAPLVTIFSETIEGLATIRAYGWTDHYQKKCDKLLEQSQAPFYLLYSAQNWLNLVLDLVVAGIATLTAGLAVALTSKVKPGYLGVAMVNVMNMGYTFRILIQGWTQLETSLGAVLRIRDFVRQTPSEGRHEDPAWPHSKSKGSSITVEGLSAYYEDPESLVLQGVSLQIAAGQKVAICGRTGSGKSSLVSAIFGLLKLSAGDIRIDTTSVHQLSKSARRSAFISIPQDAFLLPGTVRFNLSPESGLQGRDRVSDQQMTEALIKVGLWDKLQSAAVASTDSVVISALDVSLDDQSVLSEGQKQLFCLARALLLKNERHIVVLDEPTSSLDEETDAKLHHVIRDEFRDHTLIEITHRMSPVMKYDTLVMMDNGKMQVIPKPSEM